MENVENQECAEIKGTEKEGKKCSKKCRKAMIYSCIIVVLALVLFILVSRSTPMRIHRLAKLTKQVEANYAQYSNAELDKATAQYEKFVNRIEKRELNEKQIEKVRDLKATCLACFTQAKARLLLQEFNSKVDDAGESVKDAIESMRGN